MYQPPPHPMDEEERLEALRKYRILDTEPEPQFDRIADIARRQFDVPIALVSFLDCDRNFHKARGDLPFVESPRDISFCSHTILSDDVLVVPDATKDPRFAENPFVVDAPHARFYAGAPLITPSGHRVGTVCLIDLKAHDDFRERERAKLKDLAAIVADHLEMRLIVGNVHDEIETRRAAEAEARRLARHDVLTGLPNRVYLKSVIEDGLPFRVKGVLALMRGDLDQFKSVNDALGHQAGDELLKRTAETIKATIGEPSFVARVSGDEFIMIVEGADRAAVERMAKDLIRATSEPFVQQGHHMSAGLSIGLAFGEGPESDIRALLRNADLALRQAKRSGRRRVVTFARQMAANADRWRMLERDLSPAMEAGEIEVHYQPIHDASDYRLVGVEALARWRHPKLGPVGPAEFIVVAEETGQIVALGERILRSALATTRDWAGISISVNLSPIQFRLPELVGEVAGILEDAGFPAERLVLEITESVFLHDVDAARRQMLALRGLGVFLALDDFGIGYSSLSYLRSLPFDKVKIDRSFVQGLQADTTNHAIVQCIVALARQLRMGVTAEGVETENEALLLRAAGCTTLQGFYFGKPVPAADIEAQLPTRELRRAAG